MKEKVNYKLICIAFAIWITVTYIIIGVSNDYKQGQIDALTGKVNYELKTMPDSTKVWVKKK